MAHKKGHKMEEYNTGVIADPRSAEEKAKDWTYQEIASGTDPAIPTIVDLEQFSIQNQVNSSSCVFQAIAKAHEVLRFRNRGEKINHSAGGYSIRSNKPALGTYVQEGLDIAVKYGVPFEEDIPSEGLSESQMNNIPFLSKIATIPLERRTFSTAYVVSMPKDFLTAVKEIVKGNTVLFLVRANILEWNQGCPQVYGGEKDVSHEVCGVQAGYFAVNLRGNKGEPIVLNNELVIIIDDSWGNLGYKSSGKRIITKKFFDEHVDVVSMFTGFTYKTSVGEKPALPARNATYGQTGLNVKNLQKCLKYLGYYPAEIDLDLSSNNRYGPVTRFHVKKFQLDHADFFASKGTSLEALKEIDGMSFGPQSRELLAQLINQ